MAIEVIKVGTVPENRRVVGTCSNCHSALRWQAKDGVDKSDQREGDYNEVTCPVCGQKVYGSYA